jgi:Clathrin adaptor complex small chain
MPSLEMFVSWTWSLTFTRYAMSILRLMQQVYAILDEVFLAGEIEETSKEKVLMRLEHLDKLE